jgi:hypothetical protein
MTRQLAHRIGQGLGSLLLSSGLLAGAVGAEPIATESPLSSRGQTAPSTQAPRPLDQASLADGVYLYGETPEPDQLGASYMVFEVNDNQVMGAFYMPRSSFDCFQGSLAGNQLDLTVINSYDQSAHAVVLNVESDSYIASAGNPIAAPARLNGLHNLETVSENDQRILQTCKADFQ